MYEQNLVLGTWFHHQIRIDDPSLDDISFFIGF